MWGPVVQKSHCCFVYPRYLPTPCQASPVVALHPTSAPHRESSVNFSASSNFASQSVQILRRGTQYLLISFRDYKLQSLSALKFAFQVPL